MEHAVRYGWLDRPCFDMVEWKEEKERDRVALVDQRYVTPSNSILCRLDCLERFFS